MIVRFLGSLLALAAAVAVADAQFPNPNARQAGPPPRLNIRPAGSSPVSMTSAVTQLPPAAVPPAAGQAAQALPQPSAVPPVAVPHPTTYPAAQPPLPYMPTNAMLGLDCNVAQGCPTTTCLTDCLCGPPGRLWVSAEYIGWVARGQRVPALATGSPPGTPRELAGVLGVPGTSVLIGDTNFNDDWRSGLRVRAGAWLDDCQRFGVEGDFFFLGESRDRFVAGDPTGNQIVSRPFFNVLQNRQDAQLVSFGGTPAFPDSQLVSFPGVLGGTVSVDSRSNLIGGGINTVCNICCDPCGRVDFLLGYRYINLRDDLTIRENLTALPGSSVAAGTRFLIEDRFQTDNDFHGVMVGLNYERRFGHYFLGVRPSVALGVMDTNVNISGSTQIISPTGVAQTFPGGLLTQPTNIGSYNSSAFAVVPEISVRGGVQVTNNLRAFVSYNFLYMSNVARAGDQIDPRVNTNQIAPPQPLDGPAFPAFQLRRTDYWVQGIGFGLEYRY